jgi:2-dehydro-3-deoxygluconokinase
MPGEMHRLWDAPRPRSLDVICAGEALWSLSAPGGAFFAPWAALGFRPGGGALNAALALRAEGLAVGLATSLADDTFGRALRGKVAAAGVDVAGVMLATARAGLVFVEGGAARQIVPYREEEPAVAVPAEWSAPVLLLSGLSPVVAYGASLCKAARAGRRAGSAVVVDVNARPHLWAGHDPRSIRMLLREADVVRCRAQDLLVLGLDAAALRAVLRPSAVLVVSDAVGGAWAAGPFGEVAEPAPREVSLRPMEALTAAICVELARAKDPGESRADLWARALACGRGRRG